MSTYVSAIAGTDRLVTEIPSWAQVAAAVVAHIGLGLVAVRMPFAVNVHVLGVFAIGMWWAFSGRLTHAAYAAAYVAGAEVFWRMSEVLAPWEFGKYAVGAIFITALVTTRRIRGPIGALLYFAAMLPSIWKSVGAFEPNLARQYISFNLSGPFALFVAAWFFSHLKISARQLQILLLVLVVPIVSTLTVAVYGLATSPDLIFSTESMAEASGDFAANQVSSTFGLAALCLFMLLFLGRSSRLLKGLVAVMILAFLVQSALTLSRSGIILAVCSAAASSFFLARSNGTRMALGATAAMVVVLAAYVIIPRLDAFTGGSVTTRYQDLSTTGRGDMAVAEIDMWLRNPVLGVGPGGGMLYRPSSHDENDTAAAHTEFTRMLGEHGMLGLLSMVLLIGMCLHNIFRARGRKERAVVLACVTYAMLFMLVNAFRLAAPAVLIGLTFSSLLLNDTWRLQLLIGRRAGEDAREEAT